MTKLLLTPVAVFLAFYPRQSNGHNRAAVSVAGCKGRLKRKLWRRVRGLCPLTLALVACNGHSINDRNATWCVEDAALLAPAQAAGDEWRARSDGEVDFSFRQASHCDETPRIVWGETDSDAIAHMDPNETGEIAVSPKLPREYVHRVLFLHEMGHYLSGPAHSNDLRDIMSRNGEINDQQFLTDADVARLDWPSYRIKATE